MSISFENNIVNPILTNPATTATRYVVPNYAVVQSFAASPAKPSATYPSLSERSKVHLRSPDPTSTDLVNFLDHILTTPNAPNIKETGAPHAPLPTQPWPADDNKSKHNSMLRAILGITTSLGIVIAVLFWLSYRSQGYGKKLAAGTVNTRPNTTV